MPYRSPDIPIPYLPTDPPTVDVDALLKPLSTAHEELCRLRAVEGFPVPDLHQVVARAGAIVGAVDPKLPATQANSIARNRSLFLVSLDRPPYFSVGTTDRVST